MAQCRWCGRDMELERTATCRGNKTVRFADGRELRTVPCTEDECRNGRCTDCNVAVGGRHHPGCDREKCPACGGQLISCDCRPV